MALLIGLVALFFVLLIAYQIVLKRDRKARVANEIQTKIKADAEYPSNFTAADVPKYKPVGTRVSESYNAYKIKGLKDNIYTEFKEEHGRRLSKTNPSPQDKEDFKKLFEYPYEKIMEDIDRYKKMGWVSWDDLKLLKQESTLDFDSVFDVEKKVKIKRL